MCVNSCLLSQPDFIKERSRVKGMALSQGASEKKSHLKQTLPGVGLSAVKNSQWPVPLKNNPHNPSIFQSTLQRRYPMQAEATPLNFIRRPVVAGRFYSGDAAELRAQVSGYMAEAAKHFSPCAGKIPLGVMLPHAGHMFSGIVDGITIGQTELPRRLVLLAPSHTGRGARLAVWPAGAWRTPLGDLPVDEDLAIKLLGAPASPFTADVQAHLQDHALEVLLPFIQIKRPDAAILPVCIREYNFSVLKDAGLLLADIISRERSAGQDVCMIASSDMSHYLPHDEGQRKDRMALAPLEAMDAEALFRVVRQNEISMCGFAPVCMMLVACKALGATSCCITVHTSSGVTGKDLGAGMDSVVGYAGAIITS